LSLTRLFGEFLAPLREALAALIFPARLDLVPRLIPVPVTA
jgi:hypothetical protein